MLARGCSFTFGVGVAAQEAFPFLVAKQLSGTALNAGQSGYGITEMLILARRLIPAYKPDYVLVQFSPWLVSRSQKPFSDAPYAKYPRPYFAESPDGDLYIQPPVFPAKMLRLPKSIYRYTPKNARDYLSFLFKVGLPLYFCDDFHIAVYRLQRKAGMLPRPSQDREKMVRVAYMEIAKLCQENNSKMVIVILHEPSIQEASLGEILRIKSIKNAIVVDTGPGLINRLNEKISKSYYIAYAHVKGSPPMMIDFHPNEIAHRIIAEQIVSAIKAETSSR